MLLVLLGECGCASAERGSIESKPHAHDDDGDITPASVVSVASFSCGYPAMQLVCTAHFEVSKQKIGNT